MYVCMTLCLDAGGLWMLGIFASFFFFFSEMQCKWYLIWVVLEGRTCGCVAAGLKHIYIIQHRPTPKVNLLDFRFRAILRGKKREESGGMIKLAYPVFLPTRRTLGLLGSLGTYTSHPSHPIDQFHEKPDFSHSIYLPFLVQLHLNLNLSISPTFLFHSYSIPSNTKRTFSSSSSSSFLVWSGYINQ